MKGFPEDFWWGTTASSVATEGAAPAADWAGFERRGKAPASRDGNGFATNYADDFEMLAASGLRHIRLTVEWARIEPGAGRRDPDAVEYYGRMFADAAAAGLSVWATLHNTSLPGWFAEDELGFRDRRARTSHWARHVDFVAELLDSHVVGWSPVEDPVGWAMRGFHLGSRPPGRSGDTAALAEAVEGALEAALVAWELLRSGSQPVMGVFGLPQIHQVSPDADSSSAAGRAAVGQAALGQASLWRDLLWNCWIGAVRDGEFRVPGRAFREREDWVGAFDLVGLAVRPPLAVAADGGLQPWPVGARTDGSGFAPNVEVDAEVLRELAERLPGKPLVVASHGLATDDDDWRDEAVKGTVDQLRDAIADGISLNGYFHESAVDGYQWNTGFDQPTGLFTRDRKPKASGTWLIDQLT